MRIFSKARCSARIAVTALLLSLVCSIAAAEDQQEDPIVRRSSEPHGILDFRTPSNLDYAAARPVEIDDRKLQFQQGKFSYWVRPGTRRIRLAALFNTGTGHSGARATRGASKSHGELTLEVEAGRRYFIAALATSTRGDWKAVVYREEAAE